MSAPTPEQAAAIAAEGDVLVMAGAGTGKTRTLVERLVDRLTRPVDPVSLDRVLMVTFTEAAAAEMRGRLRERLVQRSAGAPGDAHLERQLLLLDTADIGTLHGFCLRLIRDHFHELGLDPQLEVLDDASARRMSADALDAVLRPLYGGGDALAEAVRDLAQVQFDGDVDRLEQAVLHLHARLRSLADPDGWLRRARGMWEDGGPEAQRAGLAETLTGWAFDWVGRMQALASDNPKAAELLPGVAAMADGTIAAGAGLAALAAADAEWPKRMKTRLRAPLKVFFDEVVALRSWWDIPPDGIDPVVEDWEWCRPRMLALLEVLERFSLEYARRKRAVGRLDFADIEQFALDLLGHRPGAASATAAAVACRSHYDLVFVDEAQDVNEAQDAILRAVARRAPEGNRFLVGDVKQSIYRFRFAEPRLFQEYARSWGAAGGPGQVLPLTGNFRSAESLLGFVNAVFHAIQRPEVGGVGYDADARLGFGAPEMRAELSATADPAPRVEVHLQVPADTSEADADAGGGDGDETDGVSALQAEARRVALEFRRLRDEGCRVWDPSQGGFRAVGWGDMAVLLRAERSRIADFASAFRSVGVPLVARQGDFFTRLEVSDLISVLRLLDNPLQDIPVLAALRSPIVGMADVNELATVRMFARREKEWWTLLQRFHRAGAELVPVHPGLADGEPCPEASEPSALTDPEGRPVLEGVEIFRHPATAASAARAWVRADRFLSLHGTWRQLGRQGSMRALLEAVLDDTGYESLVGAGPGGTDALANVRQLLEVARRFDRSQRGGVHRFLSHLDDLHAADALEAGAGVPAGDAVQLLTIHRSKGLEFPVVAVANLGSRFHLGDLHGAPVLFDERRGLCPRVVSPQGQEYPSLPLWLARRDELRERLGEEIRLLYVAFTRARDRLLLFGTTRRKDPGAAWASVAGSAHGPDGPRIPVNDLLGASDPLGWLGPALGVLSKPDWASRSGGTSDWFTWRIHSTPPAVSMAPETGTSEPGVTGSAGGPEPAWQYPHERATREPAKTTVTVLRRRASADDPDDAAPFPGSGTRPAGRRGGEPGDRTAAERGTLHHRFLELVDPAACGSSDGVGAERDRLVREGHLRADEAEVLDLPALARFWGSPLGLRARAAAAAGRLRREFPFTLRLGVADLRSLGVPADGLADDEFVVAQGVVDMAGEDDDGLWIVDFKTDAVSPGEATSARAGAYAPQLRAYALALGRILGRPVAGCWLHFLATGESVEVGERQVTRPEGTP